MRLLTITVVCILMTTTLIIFHQNTMAQVQLIPREVLFGNPERAMARISPDGKRISYLAPKEDVLNIWIQTIGSNDAQVITHDTNRGIRNYFWAWDNNHIFYLQDINGNEDWHLYKVNLNTGISTNLTPFNGVQVRIVARDKRLPNEILIAMNKDNPQLHDVYHLDIATGQLTLIEKNFNNVGQWVVDSNFTIRGATQTLPDGSEQLLVKNKQGIWQKKIVWSFDEQSSSSVVQKGFSQDGKFLYIIESRNTNTTCLRKLNLMDNSIENIYQDLNYDINGIIQHPDTYEIQAVSVIRERHNWIIIDEIIKQDFALLAQLDEGEMYLCDRNYDDTKWIVAFTKDNGPPAYYLFDRTNKKGTFLFSNKPKLTSYSLAPMQPISFTARDGLPIQGYLTTPIQKEPKNLPLVVFVHGGPQARDTWGFDPTVQWLANRGYACLQINYRGSTGYGKKFINAGNKEWGGKMHNDLIDGVNWAIKKGIANPKKLAIFGGSYGGYAALVGATFTPDVFRCAVDIVGPSNLITFLNSLPAYWSKWLPHFYKRVGNPETEIEFLKSRSPFFNIDNIKIPILIAQGANDPRVKQTESEQIVAVMKQKGLDYEYMLFPDEGHGFAKPKNRLKFYAAAEKFLAKHLGGRYES